MWTPTQPLASTTRTVEEVMLVARGIATAVAPETGLTDVQAELLEAIASALTGVEVDYRALEPLGPDELADVLARRDLGYRQRIVHHMVLGELVLRPLPTVVAHRVAKYAEALGVEGRLRARRAPLRPGRVRAGVDGPAAQRLRRARPRRRRRRRPEARPSRGAACPPVRAGAGRPRARGAVGRVRGRSRPGRSGARSGRCTTAAASRCPARRAAHRRYLAQHDFVHVLADYGTNLKGELEVFAFIGRADPDPKGFAWLATLIGLFETGIHLRHRLLRPRRARTQHPGTRHAPTDRRRDPARQGGVRALRPGPVRRRLLRACRPTRRKRYARCSTSPRSRRVRSREDPPACSISRACQRSSGASSRNVGESTT